MGSNSFKEIIFKLDSCGFRLSDCPRDKYPDLAAVADDLAAETDRSGRSQHRVNVKSKGMFNPDGIIIPYSEKLVYGIEPTKDRFYIFSRKEFKIKAHVPQPGSIVIFDRSLQFRDGVLSCFQDEEGMICFSDQFEERELEHVARMIAAVQYYPER